MLSFNPKDGRAIARVISGRHAGKKIYLSEKIVSEPVEPDDPYDIIYEDEIHEYMPKINMKQMNNLRRSLKYNQDPEEDMRDIYAATKKTLDTRKNKEIVLTDGELVPMPMKEKDQRSSIYISGSSGSGKSTLVSKYMNEYRLLFPRNRIFIFSKLHEDAVLDQYNPIRIKIDDELCENPIQIKELKNSLTIFDDVDVLEKPYIDCIVKLQSDVLELGRHENISTISTSHLLMNYKATRRLLNESQLIFFFPHGSSKYHIQRFLKVYAGVTDKRQVAKILSLPSRWVGVHSHYPNYIIYQSGVYLLS